MLSNQLRSLIRRANCEKNIRNFSLTPFNRSDDESNKKTKAKERLNLLLQSIIKDDSLAKEQTNLLPDNEQLRPKKFKRLKVAKPKEFGEQIVEAAKDVATKIIGDPQQTEAELLHKVLYKNEKLQESVVKAAGNQNLNELLSAMNVEKDLPSKIKHLKESRYNRADQIRSFVKDRSKPRRERTSAMDFVKINIFEGEPLNWFNVQQKNDNIPELTTWRHCHNRELKLKVTHSPSNYWEQMIVWTERGILWKFPIDNEQGLDEEKQVSFVDHVFLEPYLEDWCPNRGPIRHFMELVCVGLSRNHWITAEEKKAHILWYKDYFSNKKEIIKEIGAGEIMENVNQEATT